MIKEKLSLKEEVKGFQLKLISRIFAEKKEDSWQGELSSSALSTAVGIFSLSQFDQDQYVVEIKSGLNWLVKNINEDGSYGDTVASPGNISTTLLVWAAFSVSTKLGRDDQKTISKIESYISKEAGSLEPDKIIDKVLSFYGDDHTFSVPILTTCTLAGCFGEDKSIWKRIPQLPFELSVFPSKFFKNLKLDVVSYALPALIAIGIVRFKHRRSFLNPLSYIRSGAVNKALNKLQSIQPENGGFLEASPLTGFVLMALSNSGHKSHVVAEKCASFLKNSQRQDGSLPIDTHLHTWVTTLTANALTENDKATWLDKYSKRDLKKFLLAQQHKEIHPYTNAEPGGFAWSPLPGAVPDADDTAGALVALRRLSEKGHMPIAEAIFGIRWLISLQNSDGGIPTFCHGWGKLPFDKSCPDITAHVIRAFIEWENDIPGLKAEMHTSIKKMLTYLTNVQRSDGSWQPLWFGNQQTEGQVNLTYGTAQVVIALNECGLTDFDFADILKKGESWLIGAQNVDGTWGGAVKSPASIEETALGTNALISSGHYPEQADKGMQGLLTLTEGGVKFTSSPIGLYFASLWYDEKMYPLVYSMAAVEKYLLKSGE
ncbi:MAG: hypothetical protein NE334_05890 [Lentisphaeraceae bacterium]|nr:hypothetical protein [Lentisphaeraceae bacterium]